MKNPHITKSSKNKLDLIEDLLHEYGKGNFSARLRTKPEDKKLQSVYSGLNILGEELAIGQQELRNKNALLKEIYQAIDEIIYALEVEYTPSPKIIFKFISIQIEELLGYPEDEYIDNMALRKEIIHPDDRELYKHHLNRGLKGERTRCDYRLKIHGEDRYLWLEDQLIPKKDSEGRVIGLMGCARDITVRKNQEMNIKHAFREIKLIDQINSAALRGSSIQQVSELLLDSLKKITGVMSSRLYLYDQEMESLNIEAENISNELHEKFEETMGHQMEVSTLPIDNSPVLQELLENKMLLITSDKSEIDAIIAGHYKFDTDRKVNPSKVRSALKIRTMGLLPMIIEDELLGVATFTSPVVLSDFERDSISRFINHVSFALAKQYTEKKVQDQKKFFESILDNAPGQIAVLDDQGRFKYFNKLAVKDDELRKWLIGRDDFDYCRKKGYDQKLAIKRKENYQNALKKRSISEWVDEHEKDDGTKLYILRKYIPHFEDGEFRYMIGNGIDITDIKEAEIEKEKLIKELNDKINELMQFNYIVSHNLRSPVANLLGLSKLINMDLSVDKRNLVADKIKESAESLDTIIRDLAQVLSARAPLHKKVASFSLLEVVDEIRNNLEDQIEDSGTRIMIDISPKADRLETIKSYVQSIMFNLISNAIKYRHPERTPEITVKAERKENEIQISIADNGLGIDTKKHKNDIFKLYKRFHFHVKGTGIGLHLTKIQTDVLGGTIKLKSTPNEGSKFTITLPA